MPNIAPCLWFDGNADEAMNFYVAVFKSGRIIETQRMPPGGPAPEGTLLGGTFEIEGQTIRVLNGGSQFRFNEAVSFFVSCKDQAEIDYYWDSLTADGGSPSRCGWLKDKFGLSWQIVPAELGALLSRPDPAKSQAAMQALLQMQKLDIAALRAAGA